MITLLKRIFIKNTDDTAKQRETYGILCGVVGIILNLILFGFKLLAGLASGSISIMADSFNNLSDSGSSVVTMIGFRLAAQKPDAKHPYGHGRMEYLAAFVVSSLILAMGFNLLKESVSKIIHPADVDFSPLIILILVFSILVKCYMAFFNTKAGKEINSAALKATAKDSLSDCLATTVVLLSTCVDYFFKLNLDGFSGCFVAAFVLMAGYSALRESIDPLLGMPPEPEFIDEIENLVTGFDPNIVGVHDLIVHDYGPGRRIISLHAEVPEKGNILELHDIIDCLEKKLASELGCTATIHMDPVSVDDPIVLHLKEQTAEIAREIYPEISIHDFRIVHGKTHTNLIFDMDVPFSCKLSDDEIVSLAAGRVKAEIGETYESVIQVDRDNYVHQS